MTLRALLSVAVLLASVQSRPMSVWAQRPDPVQRVYDLEQVTRIPLAVRAPGWRLPPGFDLAQVRDTVVVTFVVDTTGRVDAASFAIVRPGDPVVCAALIAQERRSEYSPGRLGQTPVPVRVRRQYPMPRQPPVARTPIDSIRARVRGLVGTGPFYVPPLSHRYQRREYCEGDYCGCNYGVWEAITAIPVFPAELDTLRSVFQLGPGEPFDAMRGFHHILRPSVVIVFDTLQDYGPRFLPGDTLYLRQYTGELSYDTWYRGGVINVHQFWAPQDRHEPKGALVQAGTQEWWVPIRTTAGRTGWIRGRDPALIRGLNSFCVPSADSTIW